MTHYSYKLKLKTWIRAGHLDPVLYELVCFERVSQRRFLLREVEQGEK